MTEFEIPVPPPKKVVSVKLEVDLIEEMDRVWRALGYNNRSDFIREAILYYMQVVMQNKDNMLEARQALTILELERRIRELEDVEV